MTTKATTFPPTGHAMTGARPQTLFARYFFVSMACLYVAVAVTGFGPNYQSILAGESKPHWVVHAHGALMSGWLLVFLAQAILASRSNFRFHRQLGLLSVALGALVWVAMGVTSLHMIIANHPPQEHWLFDLLLMAGYAMATFGVFFTWGLLARKKDPAAHKRLLLLATLVTLQAAVDRIHWLPTFGINYPYIYFIYLDLMLIPLFIYDSIALRRIHRITWFGLVFIVASQLVVSAFWGSPGWHKFWFNLTAPFTEKIVEVKLDDAQIDPLLGAYAGGPLGNMTINREGVKLFLQLTGQGKQELGATSDTEFFLKADIAHFSFVKDAHGAVTKVVVREGSHTWEMLRVNQP